MSLTMISASISNRMETEADANQCTLQHNADTRTYVKRNGESVNAFRVYVRMPILCKIEKKKRKS